MSDHGFSVGDEVEVCDYAIDPASNGVVFTIDKIIDTIAYEPYPYNKYPGTRWSGAMYLKNLRHVSRPEDFICDIF